MDIWVMPSSGGTARQITELGDAYVPRWSPDGNRIAFHRTPRRGATNIFIADVSGLQSAVENIPHQRIAGLVTLEGEPAPGAIVEAKDADGVAYRATTSTDGRYQIWAEPGSYEVSLPGAEGADPVSLTINSGESQEEIDFAPTALEQTYPTWPFQTAIVVIGLATLVCVIPLYSRRTRLGSLVVSPKRAFEEIAAEPDWVGPFFIALGATLVIAVAFVGAFLPMFGTSGGPGIFPLIMMTVVPVITLVAMFLAALANWIIRAGAVWLLAQLFGKQTRFYPVLSAVGYAFMPEMLVGSLLMAVFIGAGITGVYDTERRGHGPTDQPSVAPAGKRRIQYGRTTSVGRARAVRFVVARAHCRCRPESLRIHCGKGGCGCWHLLGWRHRRRRGFHRHDGRILGTHAVVRSLLRRSCLHGTDT